MRKKVRRFLFLDTHFRVQNEFAFHALAIDEQRRSSEPTLWTKTTNNAGAGAAAPPPRSLSQVEQRWFVRPHANVGGGYPSDILGRRVGCWSAGRENGLHRGLEPHFT
jgi:hypothetical protein